MQEYKRNNIDIVKLTWIDSNTWPGWHPVTSSLDWAENAILDCETVGYLVFEDEDKVVLAMNLFYGKDEDSELVASFGDLMTIPKFAVTKREKV